MTTLAEEEPFAAVVADGYFNTTCAKCFATTTPVDSQPIASFPRCEACHIVHYCGKKCQKEDWKDHKVECKLLQKSLFPPNANTRLVSRMILRAKREPDFKAFNGRTWNSLMDNIKNKLKDPKFRNELAPEMVQLTKMFMGKLAPSFEKVLSAWGKMKTNSFSIFDDGLVMARRGSALYIGLSVLDHSCRPDCYSIWKGSKMILRTVKENVEFSDKLTISYLDGKLPQSTRARRTELNDGYVFCCECEECLDEKLNAKRQSGLCQFCSKGWFPLDAPVCSDCGKTASDKQVEQVMKLNEEIAIYILKMGFSESMGQERYRCSIAKFNSSSKILPMHNSSIYGLAEAVIHDAFPFDAKLSAKYIDICFPFVHELPRGLFRSSFHCLRVQAYMNAVRPIEQQIQATKEAIEEVKVTHGDHPLTRAVEKGLLMLQLTKNFTGGLKL